MESSFRTWNPINNVKYRRKIDSVEGLVYLESKSRIGVHKHTDSIRNEGTTASFKLLSEWTQSLKR